MRSERDRRRVTASTIFSQNPRVVSVESYASKAFAVPVTSFSASESSASCPNSTISGARTVCTVSGTPCVVLQGVIRGISA